MKRTLTCEKCKKECSQLFIFKPNEDDEAQWLCSKCVRKEQEKLRE